MKPRKWMQLFGFEPKQGLRTLRRLPTYLQEFSQFKRQQKQSNTTFPLGAPYPCLNDKDKTSGTAKGHYFWQDLLVAQRIYRHHPRHHVDVGSRIDGFVGHVASFREIEVFDIRPLSSSVPNVSFRQVNLMAEIPLHLLEYSPSLSCLHTLEHLGLGRYGDPIDFDGHRRGLENLSKLAQPGGRVYLSVPIGPQRIEFNAHRVFSLRHLIALIQDHFRIDRFSVVDDDGDLADDLSLNPSRIDSNAGCSYGCGIFELMKLE